MPRPKRAAPSDMQKKVLAFVWRYSNEHGMSPTITEINEEFHMASAQYHIAMLCRLGYTTMQPLIPRSIRLTDRALPEEAHTEHAMLTIADHVRQTITKEFQHA